MAGAFLGLAQGCQGPSIWAILYCIPCPGHGRELHQNGAARTQTGAHMGAGTAGGGFARYATAPAPGGVCLFI